MTRQHHGEHELLLLRHPFAGNQIPAGTVEIGETAEEAVRREVAEETGLTAVSNPVYLGQEDDELPRDSRILTQSATVYSRPDAGSFDWARIRHGITVTVLRQSGNFTQVKYVEYDQVPASQFVTYSICGWVRNTSLATHRRRHFYQLSCMDSTPSQWQIHTDHHDFSLFWAPLRRLPAIIAPQNEWVRYLTR